MENNMLNQIEKIQKVINHLLGHCAKAGADVTPELSDKDETYEKLGVMLLKAQDNDLPRRTGLELKRWITNDNSALLYYIEFQNLTAMLHMYHSNYRSDITPPCETISQ